MKRGVKEYLLELKLINHCDQSLFILDQGVWERLNLVYFSLSLSIFEEAEWRGVGDSCYKSVSTRKLSRGLIYGNLDEKQI